jgi:hypothetical protein
VAVITVPSNVFRSTVARRSEEKYCPAETLVYFGAVTAPEVREPSENAYQVMAAAAGTPAPGRSLVVRLRGNETLIAEILRTTSWHQLQELLK